MFRFSKTLVASACLCAGLLTPPVVAQAPAAPASAAATPAAATAAPGTVTMSLAPQPPEIAARSYLLMDVSANQVLAAKDIDSPVEPASLTKLMTAYLVFDALRARRSSSSRRCR